MAAQLLALFDIEWLSLDAMYWAALFGGAALILISAIFGGLIDFDLDAGGGPFTGPVIASFLAFFGGAGLITLDVLKFGPVTSVISSAAISLCGSAAVYAALYKLVMATEGGTGFEPSQSVGLQAQVITRIPAEGVGEVTFDTDVGRMSGPARSVDHTIINTGEIVTIERYLGGTYHVKKTAADMTTGNIAEEKAKEIENNQ